VLPFQSSGITRSHIHTVVAAESQKAEHSHKTSHQSEPQEDSGSPESHTVSVSENVQTGVRRQRCKPQSHTSRVGEIYEYLRHTTTLESHRTRRPSRVWCRESCQSVTRVSHVGGTSRLASLRERLVSHDNLEVPQSTARMPNAQSNQTHRVQCREEKLPECRTSSTRRGHEQVAGPARDLRHAMTLKSHRARRVPPECPVESDPECSVPCREVARVLPVSGNLDSIESVVGGRVAPHACERVHAGRWRPKLAPRTREDRARP
jgi:hypothetical protein